MPMSVPWRRRSNGSAASSTRSSVAPAPLAMKPGPDPLDQGVARDVVAGHHDHAPAATRPDPVLGESDAGRRRGAGHVDVGVRPAGADVLGELAVAHREDAEQEAPVELVGLLLEEHVDLRDPPRDLRPGPRLPDRLQQLLELPLLRPPALERVVALRLVGEAVEAGEGAREHDARLLAHRLRQHPPLGQVLAGGGLLPGLDEGDPRLAQRVEPRGHRELGRQVEGLDELLGDAVLGAEVERARAARELDDVLRVVDRLEVPAAVRRLDELRDAPARHPLAVALRDGADELLAGQDARGVLRVHDPLVRPGKPEARPADDDRAQRNLVAVVRPFRTHGRGRRKRRERLLEKRAQLVERAGRRGRGPGRRSGLAPHDGHGRDRDGRRLPRAVASRVQPRERLVEARDLLRPRAVREERHHVGLVGEHVVHEALERPLRADLDEGPRARGVEPHDAFDPAHGGGDLAAEQVLDGPGLRGVEVRGDVADERQPGRPHVEPVEDLAERPRGRGDDLRVERVAHREPLRLVALLVEGVHGKLHRRRLSPDHHLAPRVEVRRHHVAGDRLRAPRPRSRPGPSPPPSPRCRRS